jgi:malate permease and related proteins
MQLNALLYLIITVCIGFAAKKLKLLPDTVTASFPALLTNICYPAMIISTFNSLSIKELLSSGIIIVVVTFVVTLLLYVLGKIIFSKMERKKRILFNYILGIGNVTYVGIPLISIFFGAKGVSFAILHGVVQDVLIWLLYYPTYLNKSDKGKVRPFQNPCLIALMVGVILTITQLELPGFLSFTMDQISSATSPVALLFLGVTIAKYRPFGWIRNISAIAVSVMKVIILPTILFCILSFFTDRYSALMLCILFACPAPIMSIIWAEQYDGDVELSVHSCICSTLLYLVVISLLLSVVTSLGWI